MGDNKPQVVLLLDARGDEFEVERGIVEGAGGELRIAHYRTDEEVIEGAADAQVLLAIRKKISGDLLRQLPECLGVVRYGVGVDIVDVGAATELGVVVAAVPDYGVGEVATHALALLLTTARKISRYDRALRDGDRRRVPMAPIGPIEGETLGLIGLGRIGRSLAGMANCLGMRVIAHDPWVDAAEVKKEGVEILDWEEVLRQSDYLSLHTPLTAETKHWLNTERLAMMKPTASVINTARGGIIDEAALRDALAENRLAGAALDALENEPPEPDNPLFALDNVVITPHIGFYSERSVVRLAEGVAKAAVAIMSGEDPKFIANPDVEANRRRPEA